MAILFKPISRNNLQKPEEPAKFFPRAIKRRTVTLDNLADRAARESTVSRADCYAVIISFIEGISDELKDSNYVKIDGLGSFFAKVKGTPAETSEALTSNSIEKCSIDFRADTKLNKEFRNVEFEKVT